MGSLFIARYLSMSNCMNKINAGSLVMAVAFYFGFNESADKCLVLC